MRKLILAATMAAVLALGSVVVAAPETVAGLPIVRVIVNGKALDVPGVNVEGRSMAPVRAVAESLGGTISWDQATSTATIAAPDGVKLQAENDQLKAEIATLRSELEALKLKTQPAAPAPGNIGLSRTNPAPLGSALSVAVKSILDEYTAKVTLQEVVRGEAAWQKVQGANLFNDPPKEGFEYIAARIKFELFTSLGDKALDLNPAQFRAISSAGREYDWPMVVAPDPSIRTSVYAGATHEGWAVFQVAKDDTAPVLTYGRKYDGTGGIWFSLKAK